MTRRLGRARAWLAVVAAGAVLGVPITPYARADEQAPPFDVFSASTDAYSLHVRGAVPLELVDAKPGRATGYADSAPSSRGLAALVDPGFLAGAALEGRDAELPGTANTSYPVGQTDDEASVAEPVGSGPVWVASGQARSHSDAYGVSTQSVAYQGLRAGEAAADGGSGEASIGVQDGAYSSSSAATLRRFRMGPLAIESVRVEATAVAPGPGGQAATGVRLAIEGATVEAVAVVIDEKGVRVADAGNDYPQRQQQVDEALAAAGITVRAPGSRQFRGEEGDRAEAEVWGPSIDVSLPGSPVRSGLALGYAKATATARSLEPRADGRPAPPLLLGLENPPSAEDVAIDPRAEAPAVQSQSATAPADGDEPTTPSPPPYRVAASSEQVWGSAVYAALVALLALLALSYPLEHLLERTLR